MLGYVYVLASGLVLSDPFCYRHIAHADAHLALAADTRWSITREHSHAHMRPAVRDALWHTFDNAPDMRVVSNCLLCYTSGMSAMILVSYVK